MGAAVDRIIGGVEPYLGRRLRRLTSVKNFALTIAIFFVTILSLGTRSKDRRATDVQIRSLMCLKLPYFIIFGIFHGGATAYDYDRRCPCLLHTAANTYCATKKEILTVVTVLSVFRVSTIPPLFTVAF